MDNSTAMPQNLSEMQAGVHFMADLAKHEQAGNLNEPARFSAAIQQIAEGMVSRGEAPSFSAALAFADKKCRQFITPGANAPTKPSPVQFAEIDKLAESLLESGKASTFREALEMAAQQMKTRPVPAPAPVNPSSVPVHQAPLAPAPQRMRGTQTTKTVKFG